MGFLDALKKLVPKSEPMPWDAQSVRHALFTLRLPEGWRFTRADWDRAAATGPANQSVEFYFAPQGVKPKPAPEEIEGARPKVLELMKMLVKHDARLDATPVQTVLPNGLLWTEASEVRGTEQRFVAYVMNLRPGATEHPGMCPMICLRTSVQVTSGALGAERLETLRGALRAVEWN